LPLYPQMSFEQQDYVVKALHEALHLSIEMNSMPILESYGTEY